MKPILALLVLLCLATPVLAAGQPDRPRAIGTVVNGDYWVNYARVPAALLSQPIEWDGRDWAVAAAVGAGVGLLFLLDEPIHKHSQNWRNGATDKVANVARNFGESKALLGLTGGGYLAGAALGSERLAGTSLVAFQALILSQGGTGILKAAFHRRRPKHTDDAFKFDGPGGNDNSFVSGHASAAFAVATVFAREFHEVPLLAPALYGMATLTGLSRINDNKHWATDVVVGAGLGYAVGYFAQSLSPFRRDKLVVAPFHEAGATGVRAQLRF